MQGRQRRRGAPAGVLEPVEGPVEHLQLFFLLLHLILLLFLKLQCSVRGVTKSSRRDSQYQQHGHERSTDSSDPAHDLNFWKRRNDHLLQHSRDRGPHLEHGSVEDLQHGHEGHDLLMMSSTQLQPQDDQYLRNTSTSTFWIGLLFSKPIGGLIGSTIHGCTTRNLCDRANDRYAPRYGGPRTAFRTGLSPCFEVIR